MRRGFSKYDAIHRKYQKVTEDWETLQKGGKAFCGLCGYDHRWSSGKKCPNCHGTGEPKWTKDRAADPKNRWLTKDFAE